MTSLCMCLGGTWGEAWKGGAHRAARAAQDASRQAIGGARRAGARGAARVLRRRLRVREVGRQSSLGYGVRCFTGRRREVTTHGAIGRVHHRTARRGRRLDVGRRTRRALARKPAVRDRTEPRRRELQRRADQREESDEPRSPGHAGKHITAPRDAPRAETFAPRSAQR